MLDSIFHITSKLHKSRNFDVISFDVIMYRFGDFLHNVIMKLQICKPLTVYRFYCMALCDNYTYTLPWLLS